MTERISKTITASRFPLIFLIVLLHTIVLGQSYPKGVEIPVGKFTLLDVVQFVSQREIGDLGVPAFFLVSGFLFFCGKEMSVEVWKEKLKKRVISLLVPYLIWNTLFLIYYLVLSKVLTIGDWGLSEYTPIQYLDLYLGFNSGPVLAPLWFIRDLMILNILALPGFYLVKKMKWLALPLFVIPFLLVSFSVYAIPYIGVRSLVPYFLGAWFAIHRKEFIVVSRKLLSLLNILFIVIVFVVTVLHFEGSPNRMLQQSEILLGVFLLFSNINYLLEHRVIKDGKRLSESSFFVYVTHMFIMNIPNKLWVLVLPPNGAMASLMQWIIPLVVTVLLCYAYFGLKRITPKTMAVLTGGRK